MASAFVRTLRSMELDSHRPAIVLAGIAIPLLAAWVGWATIPATPVYAITATARTEVLGNVVPVDVAVSGKVLVSSLELSRHVEAGEVLLELDSTVERAKLAELKVRVEAIRRRLAPLRDQLAAVQGVAGSQRQVGHATVAVAAAQASASKRAAAREEELARIARKLTQEGLGSKVSELESNLQAQRSADNAKTGLAELSRTAAGQALESQRLALQNIEVARALIDAEAELAQAEAALATLETEVSQRTIRALVSGYLGDVAPVTKGSIVSPGRPLATIIPEGKLRLVAYYTPTEAVGRVQPGQRSYVRFVAFPWTQFGVGEGDVTSVGVEPRGVDGQGGGVRVEIDMDRTTTSRIPLQHGMPATVEVLVDRATPWQLLMRTVGAWMTPQLKAPEAAGAPTSKP